VSRDGRNFLTSKGGLGVLNIFSVVFIMKIIFEVNMVDVNNGFTLSAEFAACEDLSRDIGIIQSFNDGSAYSPTIDGNSLFIEEEYAGVVPIPLENIARMENEGLVDLSQLYGEVPGLEDKLKEMSEDVPYCGPPLIGQAYTPPAGMA